MSAIPKQKLTVAEYLAIERAAEFKSEFYNGEMFAMAGASRDHNRVKDNLIFEIRKCLVGSTCHTYSSDQRVKVERTGLYTYPDIIIVCGNEEFDAEDKDTLINPQVIIEVLSPSTMRHDRVWKLRQYQQLPSLREYVLVEQDFARVDRYVRQQGKWEFDVVDDLTSDFVLDAVPIRFPMTAVYVGVRLQEPPRGYNDYR